LEEYPQDDWPPLLIHYMFDMKVTIGMLLVLIPFLFLLRRWLPGRNKGYPKWLLIGILTLGPFAMVSIELGWMFAEIGRQPWIVRGYMRVVDAATTSPNVGSMLLLFIILYLVLC